MSSCSLILLCDPCCAVPGYCARRSPLCTEECASEFVSNCMPFNRNRPDPYQVCRSALDMQPLPLHLKRAGCTAGCSDTAAMVDGRFGCQEGDVRVTFMDEDGDLQPLVEFSGSTTMQTTRSPSGTEFYPQVYYSGRSSPGWYPICGDGSWDTDDGASTICAMLGFESGFAVRTGVGYTQDAMQVEACRPGQQPQGCTAGGIRLGQEMAESCKCSQVVPDSGPAAGGLGVRVTCHGPTAPRVTTCASLTTYADEGL